MTVSELIKLLKTFSQDLPVWLSIDEEGNSFAKFSGIAGHANIHIEDNNRTESIYFDDDIQEEDLEEFQEVLILWP